MAALTFDAFLSLKGENGDFQKNGDQKTNFGPHGDQSPQMGTNVGAVVILPQIHPNTQTPTQTQSFA